MIRPLETVISTGLRGRLLAQPLRFTSRELARSNAVRIYSVRETGVRLALQHRTPDVLVLDEIFYQRLYEPPPEVEAVLSTPPRAIDAGGNIGMFGVWLLGRYPGSELVSFEPDPRNAALLRRAIAANDAGQRWRLTQSAVAATAGEVRFAGSQFATSHVIDEPDANGPGVTAVPAVDFFEQATAADLVKIDIEGSEWPILADPRMRSLSARALVLEYHPERCPQRDSHRAAAELLDAAEFSTKSIFQSPTGVGMLWAWRPRHARP
jgi:FkbM family methyltransferase